MHKVFKEFNIKARLYDIDGKQIYRHDPEDFNSCRIATFNVLVKNSQVCTLNHSLESLKAKTKDENPNNLKICNNYFINNKKEAMKYRMIESIDDLLKMNEEDEYNMILKENDLDKFMFDLTQAGYEPLIRYGAGKVVNVKMNLTFKIGKKQEKDDYTIVSQDLNTDKIDEDIAVNTEEKYNRVSDEMFKFHKKLISENHKSDYNETDVKILDESRTIVANGQVKLMTIKNGYLHRDRIRDSETCSIDIIFKHNIFLKTCKRVGGKDTEAGQRNIYDDLWIKDMKISDWVAKHFKFTTDIMVSENNIAHTNIRCQALAHEVRKRLGKKDKYEAGEILICRLYRHEKEGKFNVNIRWKILEVKGGMIKIQDIKDEENIRVISEKVADKHFQ